jgi:hypothetical protein
VDPEPRLAVEYTMAGPVAPCSSFGRVMRRPPGRFVCIFNCDSHRGCMEDG